MTTDPYEMERAAPDFARFALRDALARPRRPKAAPTFARFSDAAGCARKIALAGLDTPETDPMDDAGQWVTWLGELIHERWQASTVAELTAQGWTVETEAAGRFDDLMSGSADVLATSPEGRRIIAEAKTMGGFKFKAMIGATTMGAEGPPVNNVTQLALQTKALGADEGRVVALGLEGISKGQIRRFGLEDDLPGRFPGAEWVMPADRLVALADAELERIAGIRGVVEGGHLPRRVIPTTPHGAEIMSARRGTWQVIDGDGLVRGQGSTWHCDYCPYQAVCEVLGPGRVPVEQIAPALEQAGDPIPEPAPVVGTIKLAKVAGPPPKLDTDEYHRRMQAARDERDQVWGEDYVPSADEQLAFIESLPETEVRP